MGDVGDFLEGPEFGFVGLSGEFGKLCYVAKSGGVEGTVEHEADPGGRTSFENVLGSGVVFAEGGMPGGDGTAFGAHLVAEVGGLVRDLKLTPVWDVGDEVSLYGLNDVRGEGFADDDDGTLFGREFETRDLCEGVEGTVEGKELVQLVNLYEFGLDHIVNQ